MDNSPILFRIVGTGLVCGGLLIYQILSARLLSLVLDPSLIMLAISFAMLGMGVATSLMSLRKASTITAPDKSLSLLSLALGISYVVVFVLIVRLNDRFNDLLDVVAAQGNSWLLFESLRATFFTKMAVVGALLFVPYFIFGLFIAYLFAATRASDYHRLYAADLIGAATGCVAAVIALDLAGYAACVAVILVSTFIGGACFGVHRSRIATALNGALAVAALALVFASGLYRALEPNPSLVLLARNYTGTQEVTSEWHAWNAHSRVALVTSTDRSSGAIGQGYSLENGNGRAGVPNFDHPERSSAAKIAPLAAMYDPARVLVVFAGAGTDMVLIDRLLEGRAEIKGIEINRQLVDHAIAAGDPRLREFLERPNIDLKISEAREYLERDQAKYDTILLSWSGAGASHYVGTSGFLAEYLYTSEAFETLMDHLTPEGIIVLSNGSKAKMLVTLADVFGARGVTSISDRVALLRPKSKGNKITDILDEIEDMRLVLKPSGFSAADTAVLLETAEALDSNVVVGPGIALPGYEMYAELAQGDSLSERSIEFLDSQGFALRSTTDDRPFFKDFVSRELYFNPAMWFGDDPAPNLFWWSTRGFIQFIVLLCLVSALLILAPLLFRSGPRRTRENAVHLVYFAVLGLGFIAIEVGMVRKLALVMGHPSYAISVVLAALILSTGLGSLASARIDVRGISERQIALGVVLYVLAFTAIYPWVVRSIIALDLPVKAVISVLALFPAGFLMGQLFPRGLRRAVRHDPNAVPWGWAINATMSTVGSALAFLYSFPLGFDAILLAGAAVYCVILFLPLSEVAVPAETREPAAAA